MMQRYEYNCECARMVTCSDGDYIKYTDVGALEAENAALREELDELIFTNKVEELEREVISLREGLATSQRQYCELEIALAVTHHGNGKLRERLAAAEVRTVLSPEQIVSMPAYKKLQRAMTPDDKTCAALAGEFARAFLAASAAPAAQEDAKSTGWESTGWESIDTAPKDGSTLLLGFFNKMGNWRTMRGQWTSQNEIDNEWEDPDGFEEGWYETAVEPDPPNC